MSTKNAVITGATKGIGRAITLALAKKGYDVAICARNEQELHSFVQELKNTYNIQVWSRVVDCSDKAAVQGFAAFIVKELGQVQVLVNNAGMFSPGPILEETDLQFEQMMFTNVFAAYYLTKALVPIMPLGASIFDISSAAAAEALPHAPSYSVSKIAMSGLNKMFREELKHKGIKVTAILPGATLTDSWKGVDIAAERFVQAADIANVVVHALEMSKNAVMDEIIVRPIEGSL